MVGKTETNTMKRAKNPPKTTKSKKAINPEENNENLLPFYNELVGGDEVFIDVKTLCRTLVILDFEHSTYLYACIIHYYIKDTGNIPETIPYKGCSIINGRGIKIVFENLPSDLQVIIARYVEKYELVEPQE